MPINRVYKLTIDIAIYFLYSLDMNIITVLDHDVYTDNYLDIAKKIDGKCSHIWYRIKGVDKVEIFNRSKKLRDIVLSSKLILSENATMATILNFDGVHLNSSSVDTGAIKKVFNNLIVGYSAHSVSEIDKIDGADYYTLSPIYKSKYDGVNPLSDITINSCKKVYALGGVTLDHYDSLLLKGFTGIAGISLIDEFA